MREFYDTVKAEYLDGLKKYESKIQAWQENHPLSWLWNDPYVMPIIPMRQEALINFTEKELVELHRLAMADFAQVRGPEAAAISSICKSVAVELDRRGKGELLDVEQTRAE